MPDISEIRVIDPILSNVVRGYRNAQFVGHMLFPRVEVGVRGGRIIAFGKESFHLYNARRAPGGATKRVEFGYLGERFALDQDRLEGKVPLEFQEEAAAVPGIDLGQRAVNGVMRILTLACEVEQAGLAADAASYDANHKVALAGETKWSTDTGKPLSDITEAKEAVRASCGMEPNTLILGPDAWVAAQNNPQVVARFYKDGTAAEVGPVTLEQFKRLVEIESVAVGRAVYADDDDEFVNVWGNAAVLAYVPPEAERAQEVPSYGYTYTLRGHPAVEKAYFEDNAKSWLYPTTYERQPVLTGMAAGFLIQNPR